MKLPKYLADYINHEIENDYHADGGRFTDADLIQQGIEAFESTEQVQVTIVDAADGEMPWREGTNLE